MQVTAAHLLFMLRPLGLVPRLKALRMPLSSSVGCRGPAWSRALMAGGSSRFSAASVAGRPRQNATSSGSPATEAITAILAAVLHVRMLFLNFRSSQCSRLAQQHEHIQELKSTSLAAPLQS